jgi:carbonic anhydrase
MRSILRVLSTETYVVLLQENLRYLHARLLIKDLLGLSTGDAHIIRNAGGIATDDAIRPLIISHELLGTQEFMVINHTGCGMLAFKDEEA